MPIGKPDRIPLFLPLHLGTVNCYLIHVEGGSCLIDCGGKNQRKNLLKALDRIGVETAGLKLILLTHADFDHSGNAAFLKARYGCQIAIHPAELVRVQARDMTRDRRGIPTLARPFLPLIYRFDNADVFEPDVILADGMELTPWNMAARVITTPGHTSGSVSVLTDDGCLFCGDLLENSRSIQVNKLVDNVRAVRRSIRRILNLPCKRIYPGHGKPFTFSQLKLASKKWGTYDEK